MEFDKSVLEELGMTNTQIKVYLALLEIGEAKTGDIIRKTSLQSSVVYYSLDQLIERGLATFILKGKIKHFSATDPENLIKFVDDKKQKIEEMLPALRRKMHTKKQDAQIFLGWKGIYFAFNKILDILPEGEEYIAFGTGFEEHYTKEVKQFFQEFQKKRAKKKYKTNIIVNESAREQVKEYPWYKKFGSPTFKFVPGFAPQGPVIFGDYLLFTGFEKDPMAVIIKSKSMANIQRKSFYAMWKVAKP